jgi:hypothetical protein
MTFAIFFPRVEESDERETASQVHSAVAHQFETILLVEDEEALRG